MVKRFPCINIGSGVGGQWNVGNQISLGPLYLETVLIRCSTNPWGVNPTDLARRIFIDLEYLIEFL